MMAQDGPKMPKMTPKWPKMAQRWPKMAPRWPQVGPKAPQDGPQRATREVQNGSRLDLRRLSNAEAEKRSAQINLKRAPKAVRPVFYEGFFNILCCN